MGEILLNKLLYVNEHQSCKNYQVEIDTGFKYLEVPPGTHVYEPKLQYNNVVILIEGECIISCNQYDNRKISSSEMVLLPRGALVDAYTQKDCKLLLFSFGMVRNVCDVNMLQSYYDLCNDVHYDFTPLEIRHPLNEFIDLLVFCLKSGMNCAHLHEIKHKEFFLYLRGFYTKEEIVQLFFPIMGKKLKFKDMVLKNYTKAENVEELIELLKMSKNAFYAKFSKEFGMSPRQWMLKQIRHQVFIKAAIPNITIKELMDLFNFDSPVQFNRFCMREFNCTPGELIKQQQEVSH
ncbi:helix-turn-helix domain-containing protein [Culturomica massiliensis]|jgi:AraC-like DNA-binding protein|uniref:helix-turn-helix domain-containing protein n=1 Tax=Culturomica massiliensis TaxID=1841857 RepID=UPI000837E9CA|nr:MULTISPECIES: AraC family transcriptional regulator [Odoribacteraceae]RHV94462.1 AraC family transcriptional regulator [Odoribacter sp. OF09-27XD]